MLPPSLNIETTPSHGRRIKATVPLEAGQSILVAAPYAIGVFDSFRKRFCSYLPCSLYVPQNYFTLHCMACDQCYYCSAACMEADDRKHTLACKALKSLRSLSSKERHITSVVKMILLVLTERHCESNPQFSPLPHDVWRDFGTSKLNAPPREFDVADSMSHLVIDPPKSNVLLTKATFEDVMALQSHLDDWSKEDL